ncbi:L-threonylcarbamoyladenylate synthase [Flexithrix dorotheae]|uniref:L-threonylcarbamoyladenylate synthase n=1 Tax=Flexithrix dorotheae TaxID=70993 RepID=UPI00037ABF97|nr:L-threonylcarbamoyladenylate synthase [Flexithrix dorotheae]
MIGKDLAKAENLLREGKLVAIPTETVYGLAGNGFNEEALLEIFKVKNRPFFDPLILHTDSLDKVKQIVSDIPDQALSLADTFWPGSLTLVLPKKNNVPDLVSSGLTTVAIRIPNHPISLKLLSKLEFPLAAPSANPFGYISPTTPFHVSDQLGDKIPYILDGGNCNIGIESTIIGFPNNKPTIFRKGGLSIEQIENVIGPVSINSNSNSNPDAPGMLKKHYSPRNRIEIGDIDLMMKKYHNKTIGILSFFKSYDQIPKDLQFVLSPKMDLNEAGKNLFTALRALDQLNPEVILTEYFPEEGLGLAINDRLKRAAAADH